MSQQVVPVLAQSASVSDNGDLSPEFKKLHNYYRKYIICCGVTTAVVLILVVIMIVLSFTMFHVKEPVVRMNSVSFLGLDIINTTDPTGSAHITVMADLSVKNPNMVSFRYGNGSSSIFYDQVAIGEATIPPGFAKAKRTLNLNVTYDVMLEKVMGVARIGDDLRAGAMPVTSYTSIKGKVKILNLFKKNVFVRLYCTMTVNITTRAIQDQVCRKDVSM